MFIYPTATAASSTARPTKSSTNYNTGRPPPPIQTHQAVDLHSIKPSKPASSSSLSNANPYMTHSPLFPSSISLFLVFLSISLLCAFLLLRFTFYIFGYPEKRYKKTKVLLLFCPYLKLSPLPRPGRKSILHQRCLDHLERADSPPHPFCFHAFPLDGTQRISHAVRLRVSTGGFV